jgi:catechol-2,3-dioxygenase
VEIFGIDNIFVQVHNLQEAKAFYKKLGFEFRFDIPHMNALMLRIGNEIPGLILSETENENKTRFWVEVQDALEVEQELAALNIKSVLIQTNMGITCEVEDPWGNRIGFADYRLMPKLARKTTNETREL